MSDWRTLEAGRELDRVVAERLGCKIVELDLPGPPQWYAVFGPNGEPKIRVTAFSKRNEWPAYDMEDAWPAYSTDANAALPGEYVAWQERGGWYACYEIQAFSGPHDWTIKADTRLTQSGDTLAEARIKAWLAWSERGA
jgi:hypothetical protein